MGPTREGQSELYRLPDSREVAPQGVVYLLTGLEHYELGATLIYPVDSSVSTRDLEPPVGGIVSDWRYV